MEIEALAPLAAASAATAPTAVSKTSRSRPSMRSLGLGGPSTNGVTGSASSAQKLVADGLLEPSASASTALTSASAPAAGPANGEDGTLSALARRVDQLFRAIEDGDVTLVKFHLGLATPTVPPPTGPSQGTDASASPAPASASALALPAMASEAAPPAPTALLRGAPSAAASPSERAKWIEMQLCHPLCQCPEKCARLQEALLTARSSSGPAVNGVATRPSAKNGSAVPASPRRVSEPLPLDCRGPGGLTPLHIACIHSQVAIASLLLAHHADPDATNDMGRYRRAHTLRPCAAILTTIPAQGHARGHTGS